MTARFGLPTADPEAIGRIGAGLETIAGGLERWGPSHLHLTAPEVWSGWGRRAFDAAVTAADHRLDHLVAAASEAAAALRELAEVAAETLAIHRRANASYESAREAELAAQRTADSAQIDATRLATLAVVHPSLAMVADQAAAEADRARRRFDIASIERRRVERRGSEDVERAGSRLRAQDLAAATTLDTALSDGEVEVATMAIDDLAALPSHQVGAALRRLSPATRAALAAEHPELVAGLTAAPAELRYTANRILILRHLAEVEAELEDLRARRKQIVASPGSGRGAALGLQAIDAEIGRIGSEAEVHRQLAAPGRQILLWDPAGDGLVAEVFGDLDSADHVAIVVPGIANTLSNFDDHLAPNGRRLHAATESEDVAVVAWLGYDTPGIADSLSKRAANEGAPALSALVETLDPLRRRHVSVVAHSYGTVLAAVAALEGLAVNDLVLVGSPGVPLDGTADARLRTGGTIWAGVTDDDFVGRSSLGTLACLWVLIDSSPTIFTPPIDACLADPDGDIIGGSHGVNPASAGFGAIEFETGDIDGHSSYFDDGSVSLSNLAAIVSGDYESVIRERTGSSW